ncbi:DMT family transporter [Ottowia thiooxydans]|uniref:Drug/metabolite transporter (DMT)-like permease n=1 Tax=Ottowia thiooxydans TaxID=219182 RepID=A0ABV2Q458_9BURK
MRTAPSNPSLTPFTPGIVMEFLLLAAIWGASFMFMRQAALEFGPLPTAAVRVTVAALCLLPLMMARGQWPALKQHWRPVFVCGLLNSALPFACFSFALLHISTGLSAILNATVPLFGALVAWAWLKEPPGRSRMIGLMIGFGGVAMLAWDKASFQPVASGVASGWAVLACLLATFSYAVAASYTRKFLTGVPALTSATGSQIGAALGLALPALWYSPAVMPSAKAWGAMLALGALCTGVAYVLYFRLIEHLGPARALTVTFTIPVFALLYGATLLGEAVTPWMLLCGGIVICGTTLATGLVKLRV